MFKNYGAKLVKGIFKGSFSCFDMLMTIMPAMLLTLFSIAVNIVAIPIGIINHSPELNTLIITLVQTIGNFYLMFAYGNNHHDYRMESDSLQQAKTYLISVYVPSVYADICSYRGYRALPQD